MTSSSSLSILNSHYDRIVEDLCSYYSSESSHNTYLQKTLSHFKYVVSYNIVDGKKIRGTAVIDTVRALSSHSTDAKLLENAAVLGWCIELMQGAFLVADDIMDHSTTRRGKPCWYLNIKEKETAVNDAFYLYSCTFTLLKKYFPTQVQLFHLFNEVFQRTVIGQGKTSIGHATSHRRTDLSLVHRFGFGNTVLLAFDRSVHGRALFHCCHVEDGVLHDSSSHHLWFIDYAFVVIARRSSRNEADLNRHRKLLSGAR